MFENTKANITDYDRKYKFPLERVSDSLRIVRLISGYETLQQYKTRVRAELGALYASTSILRRRTPYIEAHELGISIRSVQRYFREFPLSDQTLDLLYHIQITQV